jgi:hypothetical protein
VHHGAGVEAAVDAQVEVALGRRLELALDERPVEVHDAHLLGVELGEHGAGGRDRHAVAGPAAHVARRAEDQPARRELAARRGHLLAQGARVGQRTTRRRRTTLLERLPARSVARKTTR